MSDPPRNGFSIRSWNDVLKVLTIFAMMVGVLAWGLKLDFRSTDHEARISRLEGRALAD